MASTEEVISTLLADDYIHSSIQFLIDENMRTITVPPEGVVLGVTGDKDVNRINFKMVRYYDGLDLSTFQIRINYVNANGDVNYYQVTDTTVEDDSILFTWLVSSDAAAYKGTVSFAVRLYTVEDTNVKESFNSTIATAEVLEGIIVDEYMPPDAQQDLIALLLSQIDIPEGSGVGQVDTTEGASAHGEIFNDYENNTATGMFSHAEGNYTTASEYASHAEGSESTASGAASHAEGVCTTASGEGSHTEGRSTEVSGAYSHAEGMYTKASGYAQHVSGKFNVEDTDDKYVLIVGNGTTDEDANPIGSNAFTIDWNGNIQCGKTDTSGNFTTYGTINGVDVTQISSGGSGVGQVDATESASAHGEIFNNYASNSATGEHSHAEGSFTTASGAKSHAEGVNTKATGNCSHAEGDSNRASGVCAHAEGATTTAAGYASHAEGYYTNANRPYQHVQGKYNNYDGSDEYAMVIGNGTGPFSRSNAFTVDWNGNIQCGKTDINGNFTAYGTINGVDVTQLSSGGSGVGQVDATEGATYHGEIFNGYPGSGYANSATGQYSHAEGQDTEASGNASHAEGQFTVASGSYSHAEGGSAKATGGYSHAEGGNTTASGAKSHAEGFHSEATGDYSHAEGYYTVASGQYSHAEGRYTKASSEAQHVSGKFNVEDSAGTYAVIVGNGTGTTARSNALTVDWNGNVVCGTVNGVDVTQLSSGRVGQVDATEGASAHGEIFNDYENNEATGGFSHAEGNSTTASGANSHAEGSDTTASGICAHVEGFSSTASGHYSHAEGFRTTASGAYSHAEGSGTTASESNSHAEGSGTTASGANSHAEGYGTKASSVDQHVQGKYNVEDTSSKYAMIIGNGFETIDGTGKHNTVYSNAFTVDWNGNIQCGKTDTSGNFTTYGTINGVDITDLLNRIAILESQLTPVVENLFDTSMIYYMLTEGYITHNDTNYYYATVDSANNVISFIYDAKGMKILNDGALFESDTQYVIEADIKTSTASEGTNVGTSYNGSVEIKYSDNTKVNALVNNTSEYTHVSYTTEAGKTVENLYVKGDMISGLNVDTILYIKNLVIKKA